MNNAWWLSLQDTRFSAPTRVAEVGSTNNEMLAACRDGRARVGDVLIADHQTAGKGRLGRTWFDRPGASLLLSAVCGGLVDRITLVPLVAGLAIVDAVGELASSKVNQPVGLKWPNDVLVPERGNRKLAGVLVEVAGSNPIQAVVGVGMNLNGTKAPTVAVERTAISLEQVLGDRVERDRVAGLVLRHLDRRLSQMEADPSSVVDAYRHRCLSLGHAVRLSGVARVGGESGIARDIGPRGQLLVELVNGTMREVSAGEIHHL